MALTALDAIKSTYSTDTIVPHPSLSPTGTDLSRVGSAPMSPGSYNGVVPTPTPQITSPQSPTPKSSPNVTSPASAGSYNGVAIMPGSDSDIAQQMARIDAQRVNSNIPTYSSSMMPNVQNNPSVIGGSNSSSNNFNVASSSTVDSNHLNSNTSLSNLLSQHSDMVSGMQNGSTQGTASNDLYRELANATYNSSLYSPEQKQAIQGLSDLNSKIFATQLADQRAIKQMQEDGTLTGDQAKAFISESQRRNNADLANLAVAQNSYANTIGVFGDLQKNQVTALQNLSGLLKPEQVSPGSTLYNPVTGTNYQGTGASPQAIMSTAQNLKQNDQMTGNLHLTAQGTVDDAYYYQQAQQLYATQGQGGTTGGSVNGGTTGGIPQQVQTYLTASGGQYINADKVPANQRDLVQSMASQAGVPFLQPDQVGKLQSIDVTTSNLDQLKSVASRILGTGITGRTIGALWNNISGALQLNPEISSFNAFRDTAINTIQALAGGTGSGLRINAGEINTAVGNLPTINDNLETATKKIELVQGFMNKWKSELLTGSPGQASSTGGASGSSIYNF